MVHHKKKRKLGRELNGRIALMKSLAYSLVMKEKIKTKAELIGLIQRADIKDVIVYSTDKVSPSQSAYIAIQNFQKEATVLTRDKRPVFLIAFKIA